MYKVGWGTGEVKVPERYGSIDREADMQRRVLGQVYRGRQGRWIRREACSG